MGEISIKTDRKWKKFKYRYEVPEKILKSQFDYLSEDSADGFDGFFQYRGCWYHTSEFMAFGGDDPTFKGWHGYKGDSYFSGVIIELSNDGEEYRVGTFIQ